MASVPDISPLRINARTSFEHITPSISVEHTSSFEKSSSGTTPRFLGSPLTEKFPTSPSRPSQSQSTKARNESRKLLAHLLSRLQKRRMPPSVYEPLKMGKYGVVGTSFVEAVKEVVKPKNARRDLRQPIPKQDDSDEEEEGENVFSTDIAYDLMTQLKDVLLISVAHGWQIFYDSSSQGSSERHHSSGKSSPFRLRSGSMSSNRRSRSPSPDSRSQVQAPELLSQCISVISSLVMEDCRFQIASPRPSRPPNALQAVTLDVSQFLIHIHRHDPAIVSRIGFALLPAFSTFRIGMYPRLIAFFDECIVRGNLEELRFVQGVNEISSGLYEKDEKDGNDVDGHFPVVSIKVDEAQDDSTSGIQDNLSWTPWTSTSSEGTVLSTNAPLQPLPVYYLASLTPPLLAAILENVDLGTASPRLSHRFHRLFEMMVAAKQDTYLDLLEVVAYHTAKARRIALSLLTTYWPKATGHIIFSNSLPLLDGFHPTEPTANIRASSLVPGYTYAHQFVPWRFLPAPSSSLGDCRVCNTAINGFGMFCPFCMCAVHFDCYDYPEGSYSLEYSPAPDMDIRKMAVYKFCYTLPSRRLAKHQEIQKESHAFMTVNLFTLSLCFVCGMPLWGCVTQALRCSTCLRFAHSSCSSNPGLPRCHAQTVDSTHMTISWTTLRHSFANHFREFFLSTVELEKMSYEEVSVFHSVLWTQLQILNCGIALGSIVVSQDPVKTTDRKAKQMYEFELQYLVGLYEAYLGSNRLNTSIAIDEFLQENRISASNYSFPFDWSTLLYISSALRSPSEAPKLALSSSSGFLNVAQPGDSTGESVDNSSHAFEVVSLIHIRNTLGYEFHMFSDIAARAFLRHMHHLGFFERLDLKTLLFDEEAQNEGLHCFFPLPFGLDLSTDVETLIAAIEACLLDLDLSVNETGFLLLCRRLWPSGMASEYALKRLTRNVVAWIFAEDDSLATILRDFLPHGKELPGVRPVFRAVAWPYAPTKPSPASSSSNGGVYVALRHELSSKYAFRWLLALHNQDPAAYAQIIFEVSIELAEGDAAGDQLAMRQRTEGSQKEIEFATADMILRYIIKLSQVLVFFSVFDDIFLRWLEYITERQLYEQSIPSLNRLFSRDSDASNRSSTLGDTSSRPDAVTLPVIDPWRIIMNTATESKEGFSRSLHWLSTFARSGVDVSVSTYMHFASLATNFDASLHDCILLVESALSSTWLKSIGRQKLQTMFSVLHSRLAPKISDYLKAQEGMALVFRFIRHSLASCLLLYGCERTALLSSGMVIKEEIAELPSRRKLATRVSMVSDPIIIDARLMAALENYLKTGADDITCLIAKFLNMFLNDSPLLEPYEVDNFILRNGPMLCACAWQLYDIQRHDISGIRISFLLRVLVVDSQPFQAILDTLFQAKGPMELRLLALSRIFRIILDITYPNFVVEDRQWKSSLTDILYHYFSSMWQDEKEEIRLAVESWSRTLLPAHFHAISLCWNEALSSAPIVERVKLVSFLVQLHPHFSEWKVLAWNVIVENLLEDDYMQKNGNNEDGPAAAHLSMYGLSAHNSSTQRNALDPDLTLLRTSIISLSLMMIADGISIDTFTLLKIKQHLIQLIGFDNVSVIPAATGHSFHVRFQGLETLSNLASPCIQEIAAVLDSFHPFELAPSAMGGPLVEDETPCILLIGSVFVDVVVETLSSAQNLLSLPILVTKSLLESLIIIIYKHDLESRTLKHLLGPLIKAVRKVMDLSLQDISYEIRQLALSVTQACVKRWSTSLGLFNCECIENASKLVISLKHNSEDLLVAQARSFISTSLSMLASYGILYNLFKRNLDREFFVVLRHITDTDAKMSETESLRDMLLRDTMPKIAYTDRGVFQLVLDNLCSYIDIVHNERYTAELLQFAGIYLSDIARASSEASYDEFDPNSLLVILATLIEQNKAHSRELILCTENVFRICIVRFHVGAESLVRLLRVTSTLYRRFQGRQSAMTAPTTNKMDVAVFEILEDALRMKTRVSPSTLSSLLEVVTPVGSSSPASMLPGKFHDVADAGFQYLQYQVWSETRSENDFTASIAVAKLLLHAILTEPSIIDKRLDPGFEKPSRPYLSVRVWNILAIAALSSSSNDWISALFRRFSSFSLAYNLSLRPYYTESEGMPQDSAMVDVNHAYAAIKLWLLLAQKISGIEEATGTGDPLGNGDIATRMVWNDLWPPFENIAVSFEADIIAGNTPVLASSTWSSVADIFLFVRHLRCSISMETSSQINLLERLRKQSRGDSTKSKLTRTLRSMSEVPTNIPLDTLVSQVGKEVIAVEKLNALEARKTDMGKAAPDRSRKDTRTIHDTKTV